LAAFRIALPFATDSGALLFGPTCVLGVAGPAGGTRLPPDALGTAFAVPKLAEGLAGADRAGDTGTGAVAFGAALPSATDLGALVLAPACALTAPRAVGGADLLPDALGTVSDLLGLGERVVGATRAGGSVAAFGAANVLGALDWTGLGVERLSTARTSAGTLRSGRLLTPIHSTGGCSGANCHPDRKVPEDDDDRGSIPGRDHGK
jgi:hypothetical protein